MEQLEQVDVVELDDSMASLHTDAVPIKLPTDVSKVLGSARGVPETGNRIVLGRDDQGRSCSYLERKASGQKTVIHERNGAFQLDIRIPRGKGRGVQEAP